MHIANPIYDAVFKFMMEDNRVAKVFLSAIIQEEITELDLVKKECTVHVPSPKKTGKKPKGSDPNPKVCRFVFSAQIAVRGGGYESALIDLQKARRDSDIPFLCYCPDPEGRPVYCIFLLEHGVGFPETPLIEVETEIKDVRTNETLHVSSEFINSLYCRSWIIIQAGELKDRHGTNLEKLLGIFDRKNRMENRHFLNMDEDGFPEEYRSVIHCLHTAAESEDIQLAMDMEDDCLSADQ
jgi:hypothetical protein